MENGGLDIVSNPPFSDYKCSVKNTINASGSSANADGLPWFTPCIGPKRKPLPPPYPEQATPIPLAKVMINLPFLPNKCDPPVVFNAQFEWDPMSPEESSPDMFAAEICERLGFGLEFAAELSASIEIQLDDHVDSCLRAISKNSQRPTSSSRKTASSSGAAPDTNRVHKQQRISLEERETPITNAEREKTLDLIYRMVHLDEDQLNFVKKLVKVFEPYSNTAMIHKGKKSTCHICHYVRKNTMSCCPKKLEGHSYCETHMQSRFNIDPAMVMMDPEYFAACPACALYCPCSACKRRLQHRMMCDDYSIRGPSALTMPLINKKKRKSALTNDSDSESERCHQSSAKRQRRNEGWGEGKVPIAPSHRKAVTAPQEQRKPVGRPRKKEDSSKQVNGSNDDLEDGNFCICSSCGLQGEMICCDICPRAYHLACLRISVENLPKGDWACPVCVSGEDTVVPYVENPDEEPSPLSLLAHVIAWQSAHELGKIFTTPVTRNSFNSSHEYKYYKCVISDPRDFTTITECLQSGFYDRDPPMCICDLRLVWHNCKVFNKDRSALYRQADVMSQCFELFYREHIRPLLPVSSVRRLAEFEQKLVRNLPMQQQILSSLMSSKAMVKNVQRVPGRDGEKFNDSATASIEEGKRFTEQQ